MYTCQGRFCFLEELNSDNSYYLFNLIQENITEYRFLVSDESIPTSFESFLGKVEGWFSSGRVYQFLVKNSKDSVVGTIFFYGFSRDLNSIKMSCFFRKDARKSLSVVESLWLSVLFAYFVADFNSITFCVYKENTRMIEIISKQNFDLISESCSSLNPCRSILTYRISEVEILKIEKKFRKLKDHSF